MTVYNRKVTERTCIRRLLVLAAICPNKCGQTPIWKKWWTPLTSIVTRTGIRERHIAAPNETVSTMGFEAATRAIEMAGIEKDQIGLIVVATTSATHAFPSAACQIQSMLGIKGCPAFDVAAACAGFTYALSVADQYVKSGAVKYALVVGSDVLARTCDPTDRGTIIIFGDGAGAAVLAASEEPGIISTHLLSLIHI